VIACDLSHYSHMAPISLQPIIPDVSIPYLDALLPAIMQSGSWDFVQKITKTLMPAYYVRSITAMPLVAVVLPGWNCITWLRDRSVDGAIYSTYGVSSAKSCHGSLSVCCPCLAWERT
jgi:hypothetical protein